jgi:biopolymer transport protein ExbD
MNITRTRKRSREPDLTPLIDIVFQLVIFFMLTTSFIATEAIVLSLSSDAPSTLSADTKTMRIQVMASGHVTIDDLAVNHNEMEDAIILNIVKHPDMQIRLISTPGVSVQQLITVMDMVYLNGGRHIEVDRLEYAEDESIPSVSDLFDSVF